MVTDTLSSSGSQTEHAIVSHDVASVVLDSWNQRAGCDTGEDDCQASGKKIFTTSENVKVGVWECTPGGFPVDTRTTTETVYIISGKAIITNNTDKSKKEIKAGDVLVLPKGWSGRWDITETLKKVYILA